MTVATIGVAATASNTRRWLPYAVLVVGVVALQVAFSGADSFPARLDTTLSDPIDDAGAWMRSNRQTHWLFTGFFTPISSAIDSVITALHDILSWAPWYTVIAAAVALPVSRRRWGDAAMVAGCLAYIGLVDLWDPAMETLALMLVSVLLAIVVGVPLGVLGALRPWAEAVLRPILDAMQTVPAFVYFLPLFMLLGIGNVPAAVTTVIYALPPVVRLTMLGIKQVPSDAVEASHMFGASGSQTLRKVQLPMATRSIVTGMSQTVMMALGIVVLATMIGAGGLGSPIFQSLNQRRTGRGLVAGFAIVAIAIVLDRIARAVADQDPTRRLPARSMAIYAVAVVVAAVVGRQLGRIDFPAPWDWTGADFVDDWVAWVRDNLRSQTRWINDFVVTRMYLPLRDLLQDTLAWPVPIFLTGWVAWRTSGWRLAVATSASIATIGLLGLWDPAIETLAQVAIATALTLLVALPLGVWAGCRPRVEAVIGPVLDAFQTMPSLVYVIPAVVFFTVGVVPGIIATVVYAMVPGVRITALGIREVPVESVEASRTFGATPAQTLAGVRIPLAAPTIMAGVNQVVMMVLAMVIIAGLVGGGGLGYLVVESLQRSYFGQGFETGLALVLMAIVIDRMIEALTDRLRPPAAR